MPDAVVGALRSLDIVVRLNFEVFFRFFENSVFFEILKLQMLGLDLCIGGARFARTYKCFASVMKIMCTCPCGHVLMI